MQGAARSQWLFHWQASQRSRRRPAAQSEGPDGLLATISPEWNRKIQNLSPKVDQCREPKGLLAHSRGKSDRLLGTRVLEILPKVQEGDSAETCRGVLLRLLKAAGRFPQFQHLPAGQEHRSMPLLEVFIHAYFDAVTVLSRGGLMKQYCGLEDDLKVIRGRIALDRQLAANANRPDRIACAFDELTIDHVWHRMLKRAIRLTRPWIRSLLLNRRWIELMALFDEVEDTQLTGTALDRRKRVAPSRTLLAAVTPGG